MKFDILRDKLSILLKADNLLIFIGVFSVLPFLIITVFNNPAADDFCYNCASRDMGFLGAQLFSYTEWSGRYTSTALLSIRPLVSDSFFLYKAVPLLLIFSLFVSFYILGSFVFKGMKKKDLCVFSVFVLTMFLFQMPSISEGLYWLAGSITYQLSNILSIFLFCFLLKLIETNEKRYLLFSIVFVFLIIGTNETSMLIIDFLIGTIFIFRSVVEKKIKYSILVILLFAALFSLIVINAPGNAIRASNFPNKNELFFSSYSSFIRLIFNLKNWLPFIILFSLVFFNYIRKNIAVGIPILFNVNPIVAAFIVFSIPLLGFFTSYWAIGYPPPTRTINVIYLYFLLGFVYFMFVMFFRLRNHKINFIEYSDWVKYLLLAMLFCSFLSSNNIGTAYKDLFTGTAYNYDVELKSRYKTIKNSTDTIIYVPELTSIPETMFSKDITVNSKSWINQCYDSYFKPKNIIIETVENK